MIREVIQRSLLKVDGSCRDINFSENISTAGASSLLETIGSHWELTQATDADGNAVPAEDFEAFLAKEKGGLSTLWKSTLSPRHLQAFFYWPEPDHVL